MTRISARWGPEPRGKLGGGEMGKAVAVMDLLWSCCGLCRDGARRLSIIEDCKGQWILALMAG